jgi:hypothetical protein
LKILIWETSYPTSKQEVALTLSCTGRLGLNLKLNKQYQTLKLNANQVGGHGSVSDVVVIEIEVVLVVAAYILG